MKQVAGLLAEKELKLVEMKKIAIFQSNYIPWKGYFDSINSVDAFVLYDDMQYTKRDWRNRNIIKTKDGNKWLSIPVEVKGKYFQKINETKVSDQKWRKDHWNTIFHNYHKAPFFNDYEEVFRKLYLESEEDNLSIINYAFIQAICDILGITTTLMWSSDFSLAEDRNERLINICKQTGSSDYYSGPKAKFYIDEPLFEKNGVKVHWFDYENYQEYSQLYAPFDHAVTILDLIFNEGPCAKKFMKSFGE
jgi:hypothetical protein